LTFLPLWLMRVSGVLMHEKTLTDTKARMLDTYKVAKSVQEE